MSIIFKSADGFFTTTIPIIGPPTLLTAEVYQYNAYANKLNIYLTLMKYLNMGVKTSLTLTMSLI